MKSRDGSLIDLPGCGTGASSRALPSALPLPVPVMMTPVYGTTGRTVPTAAALIIIDGIHRNHICGGKQYEAYRSDQRKD